MKVYPTGIFRSAHWKGKILIISKQIFPINIAQPS